MDGIVRHNLFINACSNNVSHLKLFLSHLALCGMGQPNHGLQNYATA